MNSVDTTNLLSELRAINHRKCACSLLDCYCGAKVEYEWTWDASFSSSKLELFKNNLAVKFNPGYSNGTSVVRGDRVMRKGRHHYWEIKFLTEVYGTDIMIGVGTSKADLVSQSYCSLLGRDRESWGLSYLGYVQHDGKKHEYCSGFKKDNIVGIHLDTWKGTLQFFLDRKPIGIALTGLRDLQLYPMACSTAAESKMRIIYSKSVPASLQMDCLGILRPMQRAYLSTAFPSLRYLSESIFADILRKETDDDEDDDLYDFTLDSTILDDYDYAIVGCRRRTKKLRLDEIPIIKSVTHRPAAPLKLETFNI